MTLGFGEFAGPSWGSLVHQAGHALAEILIAIIAHGLFTERKHFSHFTGLLALSQSQESIDALDQLERTAGEGLLETAIELLAGEGAELSGKGHERDPLRMETDGDDFPQECCISRHLSSSSFVSGSRIFF